MLRKFLDGLIFGAGFTIALAVVWTVYVYLVVPKLMFSMSHEAKAPAIQNPKDAKIAEPRTKAVESGAKVTDNPRDYAFFKSTASKMEIPSGGGMLGLAIVATPSGARRPETYQLWLTQSEFWEIRTTGDRAQVGRLPRPENAGSEDIDRVMREKLNIGAHQATTTISGLDVESLKAGGDSGRRSLNGKLKITVEGVVFLLPNEYAK